MGVSDELMRLHLAKKSPNGIEVLSDHLNQQQAPQVDDREKNPRATSKQLARSSPGISAKKRGRRPTPHCT